MGLEILLKDDSIKRGINPLTIDNQGICQINVNDSRMISIEKSLGVNGFPIHSTIGALDQTKEIQLSLKDLEDNLFGRVTGRSSIGYSKSGEKYD